jgi:hypothetical protein
MGNAMDTLLGGVTAPGTTLTALTMASGDSLTVRNFDIAKKAYLLDMWAFNNVAGIVRLRSPRLHDNVQGIRFRSTVATPIPLLESRAPQTLIAQDALIAEQSGSAVAGEIESTVMQIWYDDLPGVAGRFIDAAALRARYRNTVTVEVTITTGSTIGYGTAAAFNTNFDLLKANTDYAVLGAHADVVCTLMTLKGADTGNLRVAIPGPVTTPHLTDSWFVRTSERTGIKCIPVINSANKAGTFAEAWIDDEAGTVNANYVLAELAPG